MSGRLVELKAPPRDLSDRVGGAAHKLLVVGHDQYSALVAANVVAQPSAGGCVQVVGRLVHDEQFWL